MHQQQQQPTQKKSFGINYVFLTIFLLLLLSQVDMTKSRELIPAIARNHHQTRKACLMKARMRTCWRFESPLRYGRQTHQVTGRIARRLCEVRRPFHKCLRRWNNTRRRGARYWTIEARPLRVSGNRIHDHRLGTWVDLVNEGGVPSSPIVHVEQLDEHIKFFAFTEHADERSRACHDCTDCTDVPQSGWEHSKRR